MAIRPGPIDADNAIEVSNVTKEFRLHRDQAHSLKELITRRDRRAGTDRFLALDDVSLEIPKGSMYALVGHNGSGKSTLLRCIAGIYQPTAGSVRSRGRMSTLLELGAGFHPDLTGRENVYMNATILGMTASEIEERFDDIVAFAGVGEFIDSPVKIYSSGMYVRLGFSVAVHVDPEILIIDEVIAVGDAEFQRKCFDHLYGLRKKGVTIVVVTHGLDTVESMCDGAAWIEHGKLQMVGTGARVVASYMDRVNEAEREARDAATADEERGASTIEPGERLTIESVEFLDENDESVPFGEHSRPLTVRVHYLAHDPIDDPVFGIALYSASQIHITGTNTKIDAFETGRVEGPGQVDFRIDTLPLTPGDYELTVAVSDRHVQHNFDRRERAWHLPIRHGGKLVPEGFMDLRGRWSAPTTEGE